MFEIIKEIIVKWDPIDLAKFAPWDEYDSECRMILDRFNETQEPLEKIIYDVFSKMFGATFVDDMSKCQKVAGEIEARISKHIKSE